MDLLLESFLTSFMPLVLLMPYLFLLYFWYGKYIEYKQVGKFEFRKGEAQEGLAIIEKIAFVAYFFIVLYAIFEGRILAIFFLNTLFVDKEINNTSFWINLGLYSFYMVVILFQNIFSKKK